MTNYENVLNFCEQELAKLADYSKKLGVPLGNGPRVKLLRNLERRALCKLVGVNADCALDTNELRFELSLQEREEGREDEL